MSTAFQANRRFAELKKKYFSDPLRQVRLNTGDTLLTEETDNNRLYLVLEGRLNCYLKDQDGREYEVLQSTRNMFLGVYSFFSDESKSFLTVKAAEDSSLAYLERTDALTKDDKFASDFLPIIVNEIFLRQVLAQKISVERQSAEKKLFESEKMILLGQLAAGLAHELNNAVGVLARNTEWLVKEAQQVSLREPLKTLFEQVLDQGRQFNTEAVRKKRETLETQYGISSKLAKQLAKINYPDEKLEQLFKTGHQYPELSNVIDKALVLHDMRVAAEHATHVVKSVRDLGKRQPGGFIETSVYDTLMRALALTKNLTKHVKVQVNKQAEGWMMASPGDFIQVWVNLIKNACESMLLVVTPDPTLKIELTEDANLITVSIADNGSGIPDNVKEKIFQPNFTTKVEGLTFGLGLGLSIVKKIVENYKGQILVDSHPGFTQFTIQLPKQR